MRLLWLLLMLDSVWGSAPRIEQHPSSIVVNTSDPVTLECRASGKPSPKITWYKDGQLIQLPNAKLSLIHDSNLFIMSATLGKGNKSDSGVYYCKASNELGEAISSNATLVVACKEFNFKII